MTTPVLNGPDPQAAAGTSSLAGPPTQSNSFYVTILAALFALNIADRQLFAIVAEPVKLEFHLTDAEVGALTGTVFGIVFVIASIPISWAADRISRVGLIAVSAAFWTICTTATGLATGFQQLAVARAGLALGEAALNPCAQSLVADYVSVERRNRGMALLSLGIPLGYVLAAVAGGMLVDRLGWRSMFFVLGGVSFVVALGASLVLPEPARRSGPAGQDHKSREKYRDLWRKRTFRNLMIATAFYAIANSGGGSWTVVYVVRYFGWTSGQAGATIGGVIAVVGFLAIWLGGRLADRLAMRDLRWPLWLPALALFVATPVLIAGLLSPLATYYVASVAGVIFLLFLSTAPLLATIQRLSPDGTRARAAATFGVIGNLVGQGLGPILIGKISDLLALMVGVQSLRLALVVLAVPQLLAAYFLWRASKTLTSDVID